MKCGEADLVIEPTEIMEVNPDEIRDAGVAPISQG